MHSVLEQISMIGIVPVIAIDDVEKAVPLARALAAGGIPCAEVTFRTQAGAQALARIAAEVPEVLLGAGTVTTTEQVDKAIAAGAKFVVSPGFNPTVVDYCLAKGMPITPGCATPSDMEQAIARGLDVVKFFPAEQAGGLPYLKAVAAPYTSLRFMPTGGINPKNINTYLGFDKILACGGSWMVTKELIAEGRFDEITALCREAVRAMLGFSLIHVGINAADSKEADDIGRLFAALLGMEFLPGAKSVFVNDIIEVMRENGRGKNGHIGIGTNHLGRAIAYLERQGYRFAPESLALDEMGRKKLIYLAEDFGGFAVHFTQKPGL